MTSEPMRRALRRLELRMRAAESEIAELRAREAARGVDATADDDARPVVGPDAAPRPSDLDDPLWFVNELARREPDAVMLAGAVDVPKSGPVRWQYALQTPDLLGAEWGERASVLEALAHPVRLELARAVLRGHRTTAELLELEGLGTSGQLHHHLRQLVAAGWLSAVRRGSYEVPAHRVVPLLVLIMIAAG
ncbi:MAG: ArsR/SmtB family transcription factor [Pseudoclavibacter sp.]